MEHFTRNTVSATAWCPKCGTRTPHRVDDRRLGPCLDCISQVEKPTGSFYCPKCSKETLHRMDAGGWKKGPCLECLAREQQLELFPAQ